MNWNAISALSELGLLIVALIPVFKPNLDKNYSLILIFLVLVLLSLFLYHKFFRLIRKNTTGSRVYIIKWGIKHWVENPFTLKRLGHTEDEVEAVSATVFNFYPTGKSINLKKGDIKGG